MKTIGLPKFKHAHMIGVGGVGMSALAVVLAQMGYHVSGSDLKIAPVRDRLSSLGIDLFEGHDERNVGNADLVVFSAAVRDDNPEIMAARAKGIPIISRAEMLGRLMSGFFGIAVSGTHGKTTTTCMIAQVLHRANLDPTVLVGGDLDILDGNARLGKSKYLVTEACEAYGSFLHLYPAVAVVTNIEAEHLDYYGSLDNVVSAFQKFLSQIQPNGFAVLCNDCPNVRAIIPLVNVRKVTYGIDPGAEYRAVEIDVTRREASFSVTHGGENLSTFTLKITGRHNVQNALAAIATAHQIGIGLDVISDALSEFRGAERRFEVLAKIEGITVVDDYAHHPTEIRATISTARAWGERVVAIFQPHMYSRTRDFAPEFAKALSDADEAIVTDIYPARETPIPGVSASEIVELMKHQENRIPARFVAKKSEIPGIILPELRPGDVVLFMGAGDIREIGEDLVARLSSARMAPD